MTTQISLSNVLSHTQSPITSIEIHCVTVDFLGCKERRCAHWLRSSLVKDKTSMSVVMPSQWTKVIKIPWAPTKISKPSTHLNVYTSYIHMKTYTKVVKRYGNSGGVYVPREWVGGKVKIDLIDEPANPKELLAKLPLEHVVSVIVYGSYVRKESAADSDI